MRMDKLTVKAQEALQAAQSLADQRDHQALEPEHLLVALLQQREGVVGPLLAKLGARVDRIYVSPADAPRTSYDRMPRPGLLMRAMTEFQVERERSLLIGGSEDEVAAAKAAGVRGALFAGGDLATFAEWALADDR